MSRVPRLLSGHNVQALGLTAPEGYLLSRVDAMLNEDDLALVTGMTPAQVAAALDRLARMGAVELVEEGVRAALHRPSSASDRYDPVELDEPVEIDLDKKRRVLDLYYRLDELSYYELLNVDPQADKRQVKSAYYALAPEFHPDKYFRKQLGSFKQKIEAIFGRVTLAHDVLTTPARRSEYDEFLQQRAQHGGSAASSIPPAPRPSPPAPRPPPSPPPAPPRRPSATMPATSAPRVAAPAPVASPPVGHPPGPALSPEEILRQRREALARKLSGGRRPASISSMTAVRPTVEMDPVVAERTAEALRLRQEAAIAEGTRAQVGRYLEAGRESLEKKDYAAAANSYRIAASLAPDDAAVRATCDDALRQAAVALADGYWKQALYEESEERWADAALSYSRVCAGRPENALAHERVAFATLKSSTNARRAVEFARRAVEIDSRRPDYHVTLGRAYLAAGLEKSASAELDRAIELGPKDPRILALVNGVRLAFPRKEGK